MLIYVLSYFLITFIFVSIGKIVVTSFDIKNNYDFFDVFFIGVCIVGSVLNFWSIFFPTNIYSLIFLLLASSISLFLLIKRHHLNLKNIIIKIKNIFIHKPYFIFAVFLLLLTVLFSSLITPRLFDSHLYHIGSIKWNEMYSVVPGLANFHDRFGFNSSFFVLSAAFTFTDIFNQSFYLLSSLIYLVFNIWLIKIAFHKKGLVSLISVFLIYLFYEQYSLDISSPGSDLVTNIFISYLFFKILILGGELKNQYLLLVIIPFFCITLKLSLLPIVLVSLFAMFYKNKGFGFLKHIILFGLIFVFPWIIRNIYLTGYILYPFENLDLFSFDWKVPVENVKETKDYVYSFARMPYHELKNVMTKPFFEWFSFWWEILSLKNRWFFCIALISPFLTLFSYLVLKNKISKSSLITYLICYLSFIFWLFSAPDFRFSFSIILIINLFVIYRIFNIAFLQQKNTYHFTNILLFSTLVIINFKSSIVFLEDYKPKELTSYIYKPKEYKEFIKNCEAEFPKKNYTFSNNKNIYLYSAGTINFYRCFDVVPCAPLLNDKLSLRGNSLQDGFKMKK